MAADHDAEGTLWNAVIDGTPSLNVRTRIEIADADGADQSEAYTMRTRLGYGTKPWNGGSVFIEAENTTAVATTQYFNAVEPATGQTPIADPTNTEVNQAFLKYTNEDLLNSTIVAGRQRIILDDARFVGNVGWRQNEQTYDAVKASSTLGLEDVSVAYVYARYVRRIFGEDNNSAFAAQADWKSNAHLFNASYSGLDFAKITAFIYLLDVRDNAAGSSATYGFRATGDHAFDDTWKVIYEGSYAHQTDHADYVNAGDKSYGANYARVEGKVAQSDWGTLGVGWELLGSDDGDHVFTTPLATAHKFNGWADVFLNNGGATGLRDLFVSVSPKLPCKLSGTFVWHNFRTDDGNDKLGNEYDIIVKRPINEHLSVLTKAAIFEADSDSALNDIWRIWMQADFKF
ncbi:MAG: alginate export family protein [Myxococcota bacterium]|jgi:hypothetical protein|nr:alginate export family protein [Myxococcota bacterium]